MLSQVDAEGVKHVVAYASYVLTELLSYMQGAICSSHLSTAFPTVFTWVTIHYGALTWLRGFKNPEGQRS